MIVKATGIICAVWFTSAVTNNLKAENWSLTKNKDGITAYIGDKGSNGLTPTKVEMTIHVSPEKAIAVITDIDNYYRWVPYCKKSYTIQRVSDTALYGYQRISAPMVTDRDLAVRMTVNKINDKDYEILLTAVPSFVKSQSSAIRIQHFFARYHVYVGADNLTHIEQISEVDIGGNIPSFLLNWANNKQPSETFQSLRNRILNS
jgi:hypothetical protein